MRHPEINPVMLIMCPSGRRFEVGVTNTKQTFIIRRVKNPYVQNLFRISTEEIHGWHNS